MKKLISILLSISLLLAVCVVPAYAEDEAQGKTYDIDGSYPYVFVHGMGAWGSYNKFNETWPNWGGASGDGTDLIKIFNDAGIESYAASVGPFSSAWDRACELYAQLTGTVVDYGEAHSKAHNHDRFGYSYEGNQLMAEVWDVESKINLVGHSFGGPTVRLFASLLAYGDEAEIAATGEETSPLFTGGHDECINACILLSSVNNGSPIANLIADSEFLMTMIFTFANIAGCLIGDEVMMWRLQMGHFGLTPKQNEEKAKFNPQFAKNAAASNDHCGYDMTLRGAAELNEKIELVPSVTYYSYTGRASKTTAIGTEVPISTVFALFIPTSIYLGTTEGKTIDGITLDKNWAINDGIVPLASALYPTDDAEKSFSYSETLANGGEIEKGNWYYMDTMDGFDHFDFSGTKDYPTDFEDFYFTMAETVKKHQ